MNFSYIICSSLAIVSISSLIVCLMYVGVPSNKPYILTFTAIAACACILLSILYCFIYKWMCGNDDEQLEHNSLIQPIHNSTDTIIVSSTKICEKQMPPQLAVAMYIQQEERQNNDATVLYIREQQADIREQQADIREQQADIREQQVELDHCSIPIADLVQEV